MKSYQISILLNALIISSLHGMEHSHNNIIIENIENILQNTNTNDIDVNSIDTTVHTNTPTNDILDKIPTLIIPVDAFSIGNYDQDLQKLVTSESIDQYENSLKEIKLPAEEIESLNRTQKVHGAIAGLVPTALFIRMITSINPSTVLTRSTPGTINRLFPFPFVTGEAILKAGDTVQAMMWPALIAGFGAFVLHGIKSKFKLEQLSKEQRQHITIQDARIKELTEGIKKSESQLEQLTTDYQKILKNEKIKQRNYLVGLANILAPTIKEHQGKDHNGQHCQKMANDLEKDGISSIRTQLAMIAAILAEEEQSISHVRENRHWYDRLKNAFKSHQ